MSLDIIYPIVHDLFIGVAVDEIKDLIHKIMHGADLPSLMHGDNQAAVSLVHGLTNVGIDPGTMSDSDWGHLAEWMLPMLA